MNSLCILTQTHQLLSWQKTYGLLKNLKAFAEANKISNSDKWVFQEVSDSNVHPENKVLLEDVP